MRVVILDGATMGADIDFSPITERFDTVIYDKTAPSETAERIKGASAVVVNKVVINAEVLAAAPEVRLVCVFAVGFNNIDIDYCRTHNIKVRNVPGYCVDSVAQHTFALLFMLSENLRYYDDYVKDGSYTRSGIANHLGRPFFEISGKKWGILGMGAIGRRTAEIAAAFGAEVCYSSLSGAERKERFPRVDMDTLLSESDIISIHAPLNSATENIINRNALRKMKSSALLINVGRGAIVNSADLADAITAGEIGGAAIDVFPTEPPQDDDPLMKIKDSEKIVFSPHIAWSSVEARARCVNTVADNILKFTEGEDCNDVW